MDLEICSKPFFSNYILHTNSPDLLPEESKKAKKWGIGLGIVTLGGVHLFALVFGKCFSPRTILESFDPLDDNEYLEKIKARAESGNIIAKFELGELYTEGRETIKPNSQIACGYYLEAAWVGHGLSAYKAAALLDEHAEHRPEIVKQALIYYAAASRRGNKDATQALGKMIASCSREILGQSLKEDTNYLQMKKWIHIRKSDDMTYGELAAKILKKYGKKHGAEKELADMYIDGNGVAEDPSKAEKLLKHFTKRCKNKWESLAVNSKVEGESYHRFDEADI